MPFNYPIITVLIFFIITAIIPTAMAEDSKITVYTAKQIITMDETRPEATAVAIKGDRILSVGSMEDLKPWLETGPYEVNDQFKNDILMPGLIDPHLHPLLGALQLNTTWITPESWNVLDTKIEASTTPEAYWKRLKEAVAADADSKTPIFITWGWSKPEHGPMTREMLDKLDTDKPIMIWQRSAHEAIFNTAGLEWMKFTEKDVGTYQRTINFDAGHFMEAGFFEVAVPKISSYLLSPEFLDSSYDRLTEYLVSGGVTTIADMAVGAVNWDMEIANMQRNLVDKKVPYRTIVVPDAYKVSLQKGGLRQSFDILDAYLATASKSPQVVKGKRIKMFSDGAMFSQLIKMNPPGYIDGHKGQWLTDPKKFVKQARKYWNAGYRIHVHSNGDAGIENTLDMLDTLQQEKPRLPHNVVIEHYGYADERINRRAAVSGAAVSANPYYVHLLADSYSKVGFGADRAQRIAPLSRLVSRGVPVALHSDFGMAPAQPLTLAWAAATRETVSGKNMVPPRPLSVLEAIKAVTVDAAYILKMEKDIGSIQSGKKADFVVLNQNPLTTKAEDLNKIKILNTVFEGKVTR